MELLSTFDTVEPSVLAPSVKDAPVRAQIGKSSLGDFQDIQLISQRLLKCLGFTLSFSVGSCLCPLCACSTTSEVQGYTAVAKHIKNPIVKEVTESSWEHYDHQTTYHYLFMTM